MERFPRRLGLGTLMLFLASCAVCIVITGAVLWSGVVDSPWVAALERRYALQRGAGKALRILVLGDSFVAPWPIETHLRKDLEAYAHERDIGLVNEGRYGFGPWNHYEAMLKVAPEFRPGLVIVSYFVGNDLTDVQYRVARVPGAPELSIDPRCRPPKRPARRASGFDWEAILAHGVDPRLVELAKETMTGARPHDERINPWLLNLAMSAPGYLLDNILMETACNRAAWRVTEYLLAEIFDAAREVGADVRLVAIPATVQIDRSHFETYRRATFQVDDRLLRSRRPQQLLAALCERHGVPMLDLLPYFEKHPDPSSLYWRLDPHFSEEGHRYTFEILRREVLDPWLASRTAGSPPH